MENEEVLDQLLTLEEHEQNAADFASILSEFFANLIKGGMSEKYAFRLTRDYMFISLENNEDL